MKDWQKMILNLTQHKLINMKLAMNIIQSFILNVNILKTSCIILLYRT